MQALSTRGAIVVDGDPVAKSHRLVAGTRRSSCSAAPEAAPPPGPRPGVAVDVRYADDDVIVVAKPAGLVVHPGAGHADGTLVNGLLARFPEIAGVGDPLRPGIVHRLDRDTSGLLVVARIRARVRRLVAQISARTVERRYVALVWGALRSPRGVIDAPIGRSDVAPHAHGRARVGQGGAHRVRGAHGVRASGVHAARLPARDRPHASDPRAPRGDRPSGRRRRDLRRSRAIVPLGRPFLHAATLAFDHPATGERLGSTIRCPPNSQTVLDRLAVDR